MWCAVGGEKSGVPTAESVNCVTREPAEAGVEVTSLRLPSARMDRQRCAVARCRGQYEKFTSQDELGHFLLDHYKIRTPKDLASCEVCHR